jgi:MoxR-like ATPase
LLGGKARAVLEGRSYTTTDDIRAVAKPVLRHRVITNFNAESSGVTTDDIIRRLLEELPEHSEGDQMAPELAKAFS